MGKNLEPQIAFRCDRATIEKLEYIAKQNTRTRNQEMKHIIKQYIDKYEKEHGEIQIEKSTEKNSNMAIKAIKVVTGVAAGEAVGDMINDYRKSKKDKSQPH